MHVRKSLARFALVASLLGFGLAGAGAASASAATATLSIAYTGCENAYGQQFDYTMRVRGTTAYYPSGMRVEVRLWGEDEWSDDFLGGPYVHSTDFSGFYTVDFCVNKSTLDEDWGRDELYAGVRVFNRATGKQTETVESNRLYDYF
jgi:hypothetical protein